MLPAEALLLKSHGSLAEKRVRCTENGRCAPVSILRDGSGEASRTNSQSRPRHYVRRERKRFEARHVIRARVRGRRAERPV